VTPIDLRIAAPDHPVRSGRSPRGIAITADGARAHIVSYDDGTVTTIDLTTGVHGTPIRVGGRLAAIALAHRNYP
jgi:DNA-binding beta-propeller fold protein YncE